MLSGIRWEWVSTSKSYIVSAACTMPVTPDE
jgi:hypothetical protein